MENLLRTTSEEYSFKFNSITPVQEQNMLYLPITIIIKTDISRLIALFDAFETLPYMTHITMISTKTPDGFLGFSEVALGMKVYVQNPFTRTQ
jgi:hypothetical protein